jgi:ROS/MUCR transcriptional regulator protein
MSHVLVRGFVFTYEEKAPFVVSGKSLWAAIEYDEKQGLVKCHECGEWMQSIGQHSTLTHHLTARNYKLKHGLNLSTSLDAPPYRQRRVMEVRSRANNTAGLAPTCAGEAGKNRGKHLVHPSSELANSRGRCQAQTLFKILCFIKRTGQKPELKDLGGITHHAICTLFEVDSYRDVLRLTQMGQANDHWNERMPWPEDYFKVQVSSSSPVHSIIDL